ncbi:trypsin-like peptidase domain-containing protein [Streptomyces sp. NPDC050095]|uniref:VMAP-C domain-containing protein n=1 Tax=unclassified Streptomyces TaxID=2593676 RepID=UPI003427F8B3
MTDAKWNDAQWNDAQWVARVERAGRILGSGFLVSADTVVTCAHVVTAAPADPAAEAPLTVSFPNRPDHAPVRARVRIGADWPGGPTTPGDVAVLELTHDAEVTPVRFGEETEAYATDGGEAPRLLAYGFPKEHDEGTWAAYRTVSPMRVADEWVDLIADQAWGQPIRPGFSGAAALAGGRVVGMVTTRTGGGGVLTARMLPLSVMVRYWKDLALHIPGRARLSALVDKALRTGLDVNPERLYRKAAGPWDPPVAPHELTSLSAAAMAAVDAPDRALAERFADELERLLTSAPRQRPVRRSRAAWTPVVFTVEHSGAAEDEMRVEVYAYDEGRRHLVEDPRTMPWADVSAYVESVIDTALDHLPDDTDELVAFQLPRRHLNQPVAGWAAGAGDPTPLGCAYPVVVTATTRREGGQRRRLAKRWKEYGHRDGPTVHRVDCSGDAQPDQPDQYCLAGADVVGFAAPPGPVSTAYFDAALAKPVPVLLWPRTGCDGTHEPGAPCVGAAFLDEAEPYVTRLPLDELPQHIKTLRERAHARDGHWAHDIQLLWDAPHWFPAPDRDRIHAHCPVA